MPSLLDYGGGLDWGGSGMPNNNAGGATGINPVNGMDLTTLTNYINGLNRSGQAAANAARIPNAAGLETQSSANIGSELRGQLPADVLRLLQQQGAERGVATGTVGSPNNNAAYLQALGLTSLGLEQTGQQNLSSAVARNPAAPIFDPVSQLMTPYQSSELALQRQSEADRMALEQQRLALEAAHAGGGGGGGGGYRGGGGGGGLPSLDSGFGGAPEVVANSLSSDGYTPSQNLVQSWYNATFGPNPPRLTTGPGTMTIGSDYLDPSLFTEFSGTSTGNSVAPGVDWASLFSPDLGVDPTLYTPGG